MNNLSKSWPVKGPGWHKPMVKVDRMVEWERPREGWWKVNFDCASKGNLRPLGAGFFNKILGRECDFTWCKKSKGGNK